MYPKQRQEIIPINKIRVETDVGIAAATHDQQKQTMCLDSELFVPNGYSMNTRKSQ